MDVLLGQIASDQNFVVYVALVLFKIRKYGEAGLWRVRL